jgi:peptide/nickel transport system permease protein
MGIYVYVTRRLLLSLVVLFGVSILTFLLTRVVPSRPEILWVGPRATAEQIAKARKILGLDKPLYQQYLMYIGAFVRGDWGISIRTKQPVLRDIASRLPASLELILVSMFLAVLFGLPLGILSAAKAGTVLDHLGRLVSVAGVALPAFWLGMILQLVFAKELKLLPLAERVDTITLLLHPVKHITGFYLIDSLLSGNFVVFVDALKHLVLPAVTLSTYPLGLTVRMARATLLEVLGEDYIRTARAYGLREAKVLGKYALKNALGPVITVLALTFAYSLAATFLVESVFAWPGLGRYASEAIMVVDYPAIMGITMLVAFTYVALNLIVDVMLAVLDPRIRLE